MTELFNKSKLKKKDLKLYNNNNWYDITVLCVILGLKLNFNHKTDIKICVLPEGQIYDDTSFKQFDALLKDYNVAIIINYLNAHYSALYLKKGEKRVALYNDPLGSDTPPYIENKCKEIQYTVENKKIRLQAPNDNNNCGPLTLYTLVEFLMDRKLKKPNQKKLADFAKNCRKNDENTLHENGIINTVTFFEKFNSDVEKLIVDLKTVVNKPPDMIDVTDSATVQDTQTDVTNSATVQDNIGNAPSKKKELNLKSTKRYNRKEFTYENYDENTALNLTTKPRVRKEELLARNYMDNDGKAYVMISRKRKICDEIFNGHIFRKIKRTNRSKKLGENCHYDEENFEEWIKFKDAQLYVLKKLQDRKVCEYPKSSEKAVVFVPLSKYQRQGLKKYIYIRTKIQQNSTKRGIREARFKRYIGGKNIAFV